MKLCPECSTRYEARVDFCFKDGHQLVAEPAAPVPSEAQPSPEPEAPALEPAADPATAIVPDPTEAPPPRALPDPTDAPIPSRFADMFDVPEPRFAVPPSSNVSAQEGNTQPISIVQAESLAPPVPLTPTPQEPAETAPLGTDPTPSLAVGEEQLSAPTPLAPVSAPAPTAPLASKPAAHVVSEPPPKRPLVRPPRPTPQRAAPPPTEPEPELPAPTAPVSIGADAPIEPAPAPPPPAAEPHDDEPGKAAKGSSIGVLVGLAAAALGLVAVGAWWFSQGPPPAPPANPVAVEPVQPAVPPSPVQPPPQPPQEPDPVTETELEPIEAPEPAPPPKPRSERAPTPKPTPAPEPTPTPTPTPAPSSTADASPWGAEPGPATEGTLSISTTPPGAKVFLDDRKIGRAPIDRQVAFGSHTVRVELSGYKSDARAVDFNADRLAVSFELRAEVKMGKVAVFGVPKSEVSIDGSFVGLIPLQTSLSEGTHAFTVKTPDGASFSTTKEVRFGPGGRAVTINLSAP